MQIVEKILNSNLVTNIITFSSSAGIKLIVSLILLFAGFKLINVLVRKLEKSNICNKADKSLTSFLISFARIGLKAVILITIAAYLGVPMSSMVALVASAGVAIGLALQGSLSNFAGGIMILLFHPFRVGDFIEVNGFSGTVSDIDVFYTFLKTGDNKSVTVPNGSIMSNSVINYSVNGTRRVDLDIGVAYGTDIDRVKAILLEEASKHEMVLKDPEPFCRLSEQGDSSLNFVLRVWAETANYWQVRFDLLESIQKRLDAEEIEIPYPQLDVHVKK